MSARLIIRRRTYFEDGNFAEMVVWHVPQPVPPAGHSFKYSLAHIVNGVRVLGYDNERGKGDHRHVGGVEEPITLTSLQNLIRRFQAEVATIRSGGLP
jgi:hypothetical protein